MRVLVTGATGLVGRALVGELRHQGHQVLPVVHRADGTDAEAAAVDMAKATDPSVWAPHLVGIDAVVNCAGVLQDSVTDDTRAVHSTGPAALFAACERAGVRRVIHLSAMGVDRETPTPFSKSKAAGDADLARRDLDWVILRPSVIAGPAAYGGSALFRGLAALPIIPAFPRTGQLQIVQLDDVVATILFLLKPMAPARLAIELAGPDRLGFDQVVARYRRWLGWAPARTVALPDWLMAATYRLGDFAGWLGWRPPVRSTAEREIVRGASGDPRLWIETTGIRPTSLSSALSRRPASVQEKWFASLYLLKPVVFTIFSLFWIATAFISLGPGWEIGMSLMREGGVTGFLAPTAIISGALADLAIGIGIAVRRTTRLALWAALALSIVYIVLGTILVPRLWIDPIGPMLKIWPVLALNLVALAIVDDR